MNHSELTELNRSIMDRFVRQFYGERDVTGAFVAFVAEDYLQHNPGFPDGRAAAISGLTVLFGSPGATFEVKRVLVDGDLAAVHLRGAPGEHPPVAVADFYRLENGKIVEHWDVLQPLPSESANDHPMF